MYIISRYLINHIWHLAADFHFFAFRDFPALAGSHMITVQIRQCIGMNGSKPGGAFVLKPEFHGLNLKIGSCNKKLQFKTTNSNYNWCIVQSHLFSTNTTIYTYTNTNTIQIQLYKMVECIHTSPLSHLGFIGWFLSILWSKNQALELNTDSEFQYCWHSVVKDMP